MNITPVKRSDGKDLTAMPTINSATNGVIPGTRKRTVLRKTARLQGCCNSLLHVRLIDIDWDVVGRSKYHPRMRRRNGNAVLHCVPGFRAARTSAADRRGISIV